MNALVLLFVIAHRAQRTGKLNRYSLEPGEALVGDVHNYGGMTPRNYRTACHFLQKLGLATFRTTNRGTIAKLTSTSVFDPNIDHDDKPRDKLTTSEGQTADNYQECLEAKNGGRKSDHGEPKRGGLDGRRVGNYPVPDFSPLPSPLYAGTHKAMLKVIDDNIKAIAGKAKRLPRKQIIGETEYLVGHDMDPDATEATNLWKKRREQVDRALAG